VRFLGQLNAATAIRRSLAVLIGVTGMALAARYVPGGSWWVLFFFVAAGSLCATSHLWCWALPVVLVVGDLYPWTGNLLVNERDLFLTGMVVAVSFDVAAHVAVNIVAAMGCFDQCESSERLA
jgi:hypothetical protein